MPECGQAHLYDDRRCALLPHASWTAHEAKDGYRWIHNEVLVAEAGTGDLTDDVYDEWDEPADG